MGARGGKGDVRRIDVRLRDRTRTVDIRRKVIVVRAEHRAHRRADARVLHGFVRARIRVGGKGRIRCARAVLTRDTRQPRDRSAADIAAAVQSKHCRIGRRDTRRNTIVRRRPIIGLRHIGKRHIHRALRDRIVVRRERVADNVCAIAFQIVVVRSRAVHGQRIVDLLARARVLIRIHSRRRIGRAVVARQPRQREKVVERTPRDGVAARVLHRRRRIIDLRERALDRHIDILRRDDARAVRGKVARTELNVVVRARERHVVGDTLRGSAVHIRRRIVLRRRNRKLTQDVVPVPHRVRDVVLHIAHGGGSVVLDRPRAVVDLRRIGGAKSDIAGVDRRTRDRALAVAVRIELIVRHIRAEGRPHLRAESLIANILVRARIRIGGERRTRARAVLAV